jgi:predicted alpha/beta superfamily hydrolase
MTRSRDSKDISKLKYSNSSKKTSDINMLINNKHSHTYSYIMNNNIQEEEGQMRIWRTFSGKTGVMRFEEVDDHKCIHDDYECNK